jgi:hypothetical protein
MAKRKSGCGRVLLISLGLFIGTGFVAGLINPSSTKAKRAAKKAAAETQEPQKSDPIFEHGFRVGYGMAKTGMIKPDSAQLDAMARQSALQMGHSGGLGFKMQWKQGFSFGWSQGD